MKKLLLTIVILSVSICTYAQDRIIKKDKSEIKAKILEIGDLEIKYKKEENPDGPTYSIKKADVNVVIYKNGQVETFNEISTTPGSIPTPPAKASSGSEKDVVTIAASKKPFKYNLLNTNDKVLQKSVKLKEVKGYLDNDPQLIGLYDKLKTAQTVATVFRVLHGVSNIYLFSQQAKPIFNPELESPSIVPLLVVNGVFIAAAFLAVRPIVKKATNAFFDGFNEKRSNKISLNINATQDGLGLALNF